MPRNDILGPQAKKFIAAVFGAFVLTIGVYGNYLPFAKSRAFIGTIRNLEDVRSLAEFEDLIAVSLDRMPSPYGREELVRNVGGILLNTMRTSDDPLVIEGLTRYLEELYRSIVEGGKTPSYVQYIFGLGQMNEIAFLKTGEAKYFEVAKRYYEWGLTLSPKRPQFLYGLFEIYRGKKDERGMRAVGEEILSYWPDDEAVKDALAKLD